jgi:hypothetical protein
MKELNYSEVKRDKLRKELEKKETDFIRIRRMRLTQHSFDTVAVIGRGAFGEVHTPEPPSLPPPPEHLLSWPLRSLVFARGCFVLLGIPSARTRV